VTGAGLSLTRLLATGAFLAAGLALAGMELLARRPGAGLPTLGEACRYLMGYRVGGLPVGRIAVLGLWWWVGWHLFAR
jgi:hypothetical protein